MADMLDLLKAGAMLFSRDPARTFALVDKMKEDQANRQALQGAFGPAQSNGITWDGPRGAPSGNFQLMADQQGPVAPGAGLPRLPLRGFSPGLQDQGTADLRQKLMAAPMFQELMAKQAFAKPEEFDLAPGAQRFRMGPGGPVQIAAAPFAPKTQEPTQLLKLQTELAAMPPDDPRRKSWENAIAKETTREDNSETWTTLSPADATALGLPAGNYQRSNKGSIKTITTPQQERIPQGFRLAKNGIDMEYVPGGPADPNTQTPTQKGQLGKIEADSTTLLGSLDNLESAIKNAADGDFTSAYLGGVGKGGQRLKGAWTSAALMAKGQGLYELGVLSGPDMEVITGALKDPGSTSGQFANKDAYLEGITQVRKLVKDRVDAYRKNFGQNRSPDVASPADKNNAGGGVVQWTRDANGRPVPVPAR